MMRVLVVALLFSMLPGSVRGERPNLLILAIDTLRADHLSCYGYKRPTSPDIDGLAAQGTLFQRALATSPWTLPSFASMFTGSYPTRHGAGLRGPLRDLTTDMPSVLHPSSRTLTQILNDAGYVTAGFASNPFLLLGVQRGFDTFRCRFLSADRVGALTRGWLAQQGEADPFFLFVHFNDPHEPTDAPRPFLQQLGVDDVWSDPHRSVLERWGVKDTETFLGAKPNAEAAADLLATKHALYDAAIYQVDLEIGRILDQMKQQGLMDNTIIVVVSDHGEEFLDHAAEQRERGDDPRGFWGIGHGHSLFDELMHVPLIIRFPDDESRTIPQQFSLVDLMPTLLAALGQEIPGEIDGSDRGAWIRDQARMPLPAAFEATAYGRDLIGWSSGDRKIIGDRVGSPLWAFSMVEDPDERVNLLAHGEEPALAEALFRWNQRILELAPPEVSLENLTEQMRRELKSLGYLE